jgi:pimeloyl-ACP methyl ester carboxylesterase
MIWMTIAAVTGAVLAALAAVRFLWSRPGRPRPFLDPKGNPLPGSISEKIRVRVNDLQMGMILKARDATKPVLLYLHGGMPDYFLTQRYPTGLDEEFAVCWWDQRGAGLSFDPRSAPATVTPEQLVSDAIGVTHYLRQRFGRARIYLMGHSGGSFVGMHAVARAPELYHAYIGVSQMANQAQSEKRAYDYMLQRFCAEGNARMVRRLEASPVTAHGGVPAAYLGVRDPAMHALGVGTMRGMKSVITGLVLESFRNRELTLGEKINLWRGKMATGVSSVWTEMLAMDLSTHVPEVRVPVSFFHGLHDYTCCYAEAASYFDALKAPLKGFYTFEHSAHSPMFEEAGRMMHIIRNDVIPGTNRLADRL